MRITDRALFLWQGACPHQNSAYTPNVQLSPRLSHQKRQINKQGGLWLIWALLVQSESFIFGFKKAVVLLAPVRCKIAPWCNTALTKTLVPTGVRLLVTRSTRCDFVAAAQSIYVLPNYVLSIYGGFCSPFWLVR